MPLPALYRATLLLLVVLLGACSSLPALPDEPSPAHPRDTRMTRLGRAVQPLLQQHPGLTGIVPLQDGREAFASRVRMADAAERSIDAQYYIWHDDLSGGLLFDALLRAAQRGVQVRLLLDDANTRGLDRLLATLDAEPNLQVRLFNPFVHRGMRWLDYVSSFDRVNRRMHGKSFTADDQATIVGGRNVGDEYFEAGNDVLFVDLDVLAIGPTVERVSESFDRYWASAAVRPLHALVAPADEAERTERAALSAQRAASPDAQSYLQAVEATAFVRRLESHELEFEWTAAHLVSDDPAKGSGAGDPGMLLAAQLDEVLGTPRQAVQVVSPYFVPGERGTEAFAAMARRGVQVQVLTNSLAATDVPVVHAGYAKRRKDLLRAGVQLYEMKPGAHTPAPAHSLKGSSSASLHAKTFGVDGRQVFVGSFNFDPRSYDLNTEMGLLLDSPALVSQLADAFRLRVPLAAYEVRLTEDGALRWIERRDRQTVTYTHEPEVGLWKRFVVWLAALLPVEWLL